MGQRASRGEVTRGLATSAVGIDSGRLPVSIAARSHRPGRQLLEGPTIAIGVKEVDEATPRLVVHLTHVDSALEQISPRYVGISHHHLQIVERTRCHLCKPFTDRDRAGGPGGSELDKPNLVADGMVLIGIETSPDVEILGYVNIRDRHTHKFEFHIHTLDHNGEPARGAQISC